MKKACLSNLPYLLLAILMMAMTGCGASNSAIKADSAAPGAVAMKVAIPVAKSVASATSSVASLQFTVTGTGNDSNPIPVVKAASSDVTGGTVSGVYPGTVSVAVKAVDATGNVLYEGYALNVNVTAGATSNLGTVSLAVPIVKAEEAACLKCHETTLDLTGQSVVAGYKNSGHYTNSAFQDSNGQGAGCVGCHGPNHNVQDPAHNGAVTAFAGTTNSRCLDCHNIANAAATMVANHNTYYLANGNDCNLCHQVHNTVAGNMERKSWAQSRHGADDFANIAGGGTFNNCANRCHNAKGFIAAVNAPGTLVQGNISAQSPQMVTCEACHSNAPLGVLRTVAGTKGGVFATYTTSGKGYQFAPNNYVNGVTVAASGTTGFVAGTVNGVAIAAGTYGAKKPYYPDVAGSNVCIICHAGTTEGVNNTTSAGLSDPYFVNTPIAQSLKKSSTITQHNMPAAAVMYVKFGFLNLSTGTNGTTASYISNLTSDLDGGLVTSTHRKFGTSAIATDSHFSASHPAPANMQTNGPCAVCHVSGSHSYKIDQAAINAVCSNCHTSENGNNISTESDFHQYFLDPQQEVYRNAIALGAAIVNGKVAAYNATLTATPNALGLSTTNPLQFVVGIDPMSSTQPGKLVFAKSIATNPDGSQQTNASDGSLVTVSLAAAATTAPYYSPDWTNTAIALGYSKTAGDAGYTKFIGALSNIAFFAKDNGGFAHARTYSRRLIYDSLDFLDDGVLNMSVSATAINMSKVTTNPMAGLYTKGTAAYNTANGAITAPAANTSESMLYLIGWNRTTGAWTLPERP